MTMVAKCLVPKKVFIAVHYGFGSKIVPQMAPWYMETKTKPAQPQLIYVVYGGALDNHRTVLLSQEFKAKLPKSYPKTCKESQGWILALAGQNCLCFIDPGVDCGCFGCCFPIGQQQNPLTFRSTNFQ